MLIRIIKRPLGEAPEWVRDAWIGVQLRADHDRPRNFVAFGVLSGPKGAFSQMLEQMMGRAIKGSGYVVNAADAIDSLEAHNAEAAAWWRTHCPELLDGWRVLAFNADECAVER